MKERISRKGKELVCAIPTGPNYRARHYNSDGAGLIAYGLDGDCLTHLVPHMLLLCCYSFVVIHLLLFLVIVRCCLFITRATQFWDSSDRESIVPLENEGFTTVSLYNLLMVL
jgi:hypothetical protein